MLGLSFGGVVAQELAGKLNPKFLVLISTLEHAEELPWYYRTFKALPEATPMAQLAPIAPKFLFNKVFGASDVATQELLHNTITSADPAFIRWAVYHILRYRKDETNYSGPTLRIHGSQDHLISCPAGLPSSNCIKGGHLMIYEQAEEVSEVVNRFIKENLRFLRGS
jgi:pimeloyl-ACP methyl ester carboxylesterase